MHSTTIEIQNLKCEGCAHTIITQLTKLKAISDVVVNIETKAVSFQYGQESDVKHVEKKLSDLGYPIIGESNPFPKQAKSFVSCAIGKVSK